MREEVKRMAERFSCEYELFERGGSPEDLEKAYFHALQEGKEKNFYPAILVVDEFVVEIIGSILEEGYGREELIAECKNNGKELLDSRLSNYTERSGRRWEKFIGKEKKGEVSHHFCGYKSFEDSGLEEDTLLLKIPVENPWEIVAWIPFGGWNECPSPDEMIAICKYWYEAYGVLPAVFTHDVMEFYAPKKLNGADSLEVAKEQYGFCNDRVDQGTKTSTLSELAAGLVDSDVWFFWWD